MSLAGSPRVCLVGPYSAPDDAGLTDPCWGEPDLVELLAAQLNGAGSPVLEPGQPVVVSATLRRGDVRCDYPPGEWRLQLVAEPLVDGQSAGALTVPDVVVRVPFDPATALALLPPDRTRYCGLATVVYQEQGEPPLASP